MRALPVILRGGARHLLTGAALLFAIATTIATDDLGAEEHGGEKEPHVVPRATSAVTIDGVIDEQAWLDALTLELNYEVRPGENIPPPVAPAGRGRPLDPQGGRDALVATAGEAVQQHATVVAQPHRERRFAVVVGRAERHVASAAAPDA